MRLMLCGPLGGGRLRNLAIALAVSVAGTQAASAEEAAQERAPVAVEAAKPVGPKDDDPQAKQGDADAKIVRVVYLKQLREKPLPLSFLDLPTADDGIAGARLGIADDNTTGRFTKQNFTLEVVENASVDELIAAANAKVGEGVGFFAADFEPAGLIRLADALAGKEALLLNVGSADDSLREENCRANVVHLPPTRTMLADALTQYLVWKKWLNWFLITGPEPNDKIFADAVRRSAKKFGARIVEEREFKYDPGSRRSDGGFEQIQQQIPSFTQGVKDHDVVMVADEGQLFSDYIPYRTWTPRPVAGTAGLGAMSWHPANELWGGTQFQNRFKKLTNRLMRPIDYDAWLAMRVIGEAATRAKSVKPADLIAYIRSPEFEVAAFKGVKTTFRAWNGQLRQPIIVATPKLLVSVSPQQGFLHQFTELDTLGIDKPETKCKSYTK